MIQSNHSAQDNQPTFYDLVESYKGSAGYLSLSPGSKLEYKKPLERLLEMGSKLVLDIRMQLPVAVALSRSRSHVDFWFKAIVEADISNYQKDRLVLFVKMVYRSHNLGHLVEALKLPKDIKHTRGEAHPLTLAQVEAIKAIDDPELKGYVVFVVFCYYTGLRPSEARALRWTEVGEKMIVVMGSKDREKGKPSRMIPILPEIQWCLDYCAKRESSWVFLSSKGRPLNKDVTCQMVHRIYSLVGAESVLYDTRRGVATEMIRQGYSLLDVAGLLGHRDTRTTEKYVRLSMEEKALKYKGV